MSVDRTLLSFTVTRHWRRRFLGLQLAW